MIRRLVPLALVAACSTGEARTALNTPVIESLPGGVVKVTNPGPTLWADTSGWRLVEERTIAPEEGSPGQIGSPNTLVADAAGNAYLMQSGPTTIKVYDATGAWVRDIGRQGDGPGEFQNGMFGIFGDTLFVQDPNNQRLTTFTTTGTFIGTARSQCCWWTSAFPVFSDGTVGIMGPLPPKPGEPEGSGGGGLFLTKMNGTVTDTFPVRSSPPKEGENWTITRKVGGGTSMMSMGIPLQPTDQSGFLLDRKRVTGHTADYTLAITSLKHDTLRLFAAPAPTITITEQQRDSIFEEEIAGVNEQWRESVRQIAKKEQIPTTWPRWSDIAVDKASRIWIGRPGAKGEVSILDVFSKEGVLLGSVPVPHPRILDGYWTATHVFLRDESEDGVPRIKVFRIDTTARSK